MAILFWIGLLFYDHFAIACCFSLTGLLAPRLRSARMVRRRREELSLQFKQALSALSSSLTAGKSVENAFVSVAEDLAPIYPDPATPILVEFRRIHRRLANGDTLERALDDFARRAGTEDISNFAQVFSTCKRSGGNLIEVIRRTSNMIGEKLDMQQEISVLLAQKKFESTILAVAPLAVVALLKMSSPDYLLPLYEEGIGRVVMTLALLLFSSCLYLSNRIMTIQV